MLIEYTEDASIDGEKYVYLKVNGTDVEAYGDLASLESAEEEMKTGRLFDYAVSVEDWEANNCDARVIDGKVVLGTEPTQLAKEQGEYIRMERYLRLRQCDKISPMRWNAMTQAQKDAWTKYRQDLLDIPQQKGFPWDGDPDKVPWPKEPE